MNAGETTASSASVAVTAGTDDEDVRARAAALAAELALPLVIQEQSFDQTPELLLVVGEDRLELHDARRGAAGPVFVDFARGSLGFRRRSSLSRRQPIALAVGLRRGPVTVVDATAGLAQDSFLLASLGCTVIAVERSAVLGALVRDGLRRAQAVGSHALSTVIRRITLVVDDARRVLARMTASSAPDVVYLDPMYPPKKKTALPKKEMRMCRRLVGDDRDAGELLTVARRLARRRVVVKRPRHAPPLAPHPPIQFRAKLVRYDVYHPVD